MEKPYKFEIRREYWNGKVTWEHSDVYVENSTVLGVVSERVYIDTRYEAKKRLYNFLLRKPCLTSLQQ